MQSWVDVSEWYGITKDEKQACDWYRKAADQGYATAQFNLGTMYHNGFGVTKDLRQALVWYQKAAQQGYEEAKKSAKTLEDQGVTPAQLPSNPSNSNPSQVSAASSNIASSPNVSSTLTPLQPGLESTQNNNPSPVQSGAQGKPMPQTLESKTQKEVVKPVTNTVSSNNSALPSQTSLAKPSTPAVSAWLDTETINLLKNQATTENLITGLQTLQVDIKQSQERVDKYQQQLTGLQSLMRAADANALEKLNGNARELQRMINREKELQLAEQERQVIFSQDKLSDFYYAFILQLTDSWLACKTIHSGKVGNTEKGPLDYLAKGIDKLGSYISLPGIKLLTDIAGKAISAWSERDRKLGVNRMADFFGGLVSGDTSN